MTLQMYGFFRGGDPRRFKPDAAACSPAELARWREDCARWERGETAEPQREGLAARNPYGMGRYFIETNFNEEETETDPHSGSEVRELRASNNGC